MCRPKHSQVVVGATYGFLTNVERAIIMPSLWLYLETHWGTEIGEKFYGATVAAFCLGISLFTPVVEYASHKGVRTPVLLLISNQLEILGNMMYLVGHSPCILLSGRFISGVGACCDPPLYADMIKLTTEKERTSYVIALLLPRQVGLLFGPAFTILVNKLNIDVRNFNINVYNAPGLAMAALWVLHSVLMMITYPNMECLFASVVESSKDLSFGKRVQRLFFIQKIEKTSVTNGLEIISDGNITNDKQVKSPDISGSSSPNVYQHYTIFSLITLYLIIFVIYFCALSLETVIPPLIVTLFSWDEVKISFIYLSAAVLILIIFSIYKCFEKWLTDRRLLTSGMICLLFAYVWLATYLAYKPKTDITIDIVCMMFGVGIHVLGLPMVAITCESLYSKLAPQQDMDRAQTVFRTYLNIGYLSGPFVGGTLLRTPHAVFILMFILVFVPFVMFCLDYDAFEQIDGLNMCSTSIN